MGLEEQLRADLKEALRNRDERAKSVIRMALASIGNAKAAKRDALEDAELLRVLQKEARQREEAIEELRKANRSESLARAQAELAVLMLYLPPRLSRQAIEFEARQVIAEAGATNTKQIGLVMKRLMPKMQGCADGRLVNQIVRELLLG